MHGDELRHDRFRSARDLNDSLTKGVVGQRRQDLENVRVILTSQRDTRGSTEATDVKVMCDPRRLEGVTFQ